MDDAVKNFVKARSKVMSVVAEVADRYELNTGEVTLMLLQVATKWQDLIVHNDRKKVNDTDNTLDHLQEKNG